MARKRFSDAELDALFGSGVPATLPRPQTAPAAQPETKPDSPNVTPVRPSKTPLKPAAPDVDFALVADGSSPETAHAANLHSEDRAVYTSAPPGSPPAPTPSAPPPPAASSTAGIHADTSGVLHLPVDNLAPNPHQPRVEFNDDKLKEMAESVRQRGVLQPVLVRRLGNAWQLVAGERRLRAAKLAGLDTIPALPVSLTDRELLEVALVENLQRDDLNPIEEARAYDHLCRQFGLSHDEIARRVGKDRSTVVNMLRLLRLPQAVKNHLQDRTLTTGHARALLALDGEEQILQIHGEIVGKGLSVRQTEERVRQLRGESAPAERKPRGAKGLSSYYEDLQNRFTEAVGVRVSLRPRNDTAGRIEIHYGDPTEFEAICAKLGVELDGG